MISLIRLDDVRQSGLPPIRTEHDDTASRLHETVIGVVTSVYPIDHPKNDMGQTLVDVQLSHWLPALKRIPLAAAGYAHGETQKAIANSRHRQPYEPKARNQMDGAVYDVRPGTRVLVSFVNGDLAAPIIQGVVKFNRQGELAAPEERQGEERIGDDGQFAMVEANPVDSGMTEYPRHRDAFNGTVIQRDNKGNLLFQTTTDQDPIHPGHNGIPIAPDPEGNALIATRGARVGRVGIVTGKSPITGGAGDGTIRLETIAATVGNYILRLRSTVGRLWASTRGSDDGRVYLEDKKKSYVSLDANGVAALHAASKAVLDSMLVCLGNDNPQYHAMLYEKWQEWQTLQISLYDGHTHPGVTSGKDNTGPPNIGWQAFWQSLFQTGETIKSKNVTLVDSESPNPHYEVDPDGGDDGGPPAPPPPPPTPTGPKPRKKGGAGGGGSFIVFSPNIPRDGLGRKILKPTPNPTGGFKPRP